MDYKLKIAEVPAMFDLEEFIKNEPDVFDGLVKDYPIKKDVLYLIKQEKTKRIIKKEEK